MQSIKYPTLEEIAETNKRVAKLTGDYVMPYEYDVGRLARLLRTVRTVGEGPYERRYKIVKKTAFLIYGIAKGQYFQEGNKRTAMMVGTTFAEMNGYTVPLDDVGLHRMLLEVALLRETYTLYSIEQRVNAVMR